MDFIISLSTDSEQKLLKSVQDFKILEQNCSCDQILLLDIENQLLLIRICLAFVIDLLKESHKNRTHLARKLTEAEEQIQALKDKEQEKENLANKILMDQII